MREKGVIYRMNGHLSSRVCVSLLCRLSSECGSLHESLAGVEGRKRKLEVETGRLKREVEEKRRWCERVEREGRDAAEAADNRAKQQVCHENLAQNAGHFPFLSLPPPPSFLPSSSLFSSPSPPPLPPHPLPRWIICPRR